MKNETMEDLEKSLAPFEGKIDSNSIDQIIDLINKYNLPSYCVEIAFFLANRPTKKTRDGGGVHNLAKRLGISVVTLYKYMHSEGVIEIMKVMTKRIYAKYIPDVMHSVRNKALQGNIEAAKLFLNVNEMGVDDTPKFINNIQVSADDVNVFIEDLRNKVI